MGSSKPIDQYITLVLKKDPKTSDFVTQLLSPIYVNYSKNLYVALCSINYEYVSAASLQNCQKAIFGFASIKYTGVKEPNPGLWAPGQWSATREKVFVNCELESAEHSAQSLVSALNRELQSKLPSFFPSDACKFLYNPDIDRVEITVDGSNVVPENDKCSLVLYYPLSRYLGYTQSKTTIPGFCFGADAPPTVLPKYVKFRQHALAKFPPFLPRPKFTNIFLNCIEQYQNESMICPLLASIQRPSLPHPPTGA